MLMLASIASFAHEFVVDGIRYETVSKEDKTCKLKRVPTDFSGTLTIPSQVTYAGYVFNVIGIGSTAFHNCEALTGVVTPNSVESIEHRAFYNCKKLCSLTLPNGLTSIKGVVFTRCDSLKEIVCLSTIPPTCERYQFQDVNKLECTIRVPKESIDAYSSASGWKDFWHIVALEK